MITIKTITIIISSIFLFKSINSIKKGIVNCIYIVYLGFYMFFVLPILLDIIIGYPNFANHQFIGFYYSISDFYTEIIYCIFIIYSSIFLNIFGKNRKIYKNVLIKINITKIKNRIIIFILSIIVLLPLILTLLRTLNYGANMINILNYKYLRLLFRNESNFLVYYYLALLSILSANIILLLSHKNIFLMTLIYSIPIYTAFGIHGKRNIIAIFMFLYIFVLMFKLNIQPKKYKYILFVLLISVILSSVFYQEHIRGISIEESAIRAYNNFRVDYGRDDVVKMSIYFAINQDRIMKGQGNSQLYFLKYFGGIFDSIRSKYKYSVYATSILLGYNNVVDLGWGMTTGVYDESISNYGVVLGIFISNIIVCIICRLGDKTKNILVLLFTYIVGILVQVLQLTSFIFIFGIWFILIFKYLGEKIFSDKLNKM